MSWFYDLLIDWWRAQQRALDIMILWPACKDEAPDFGTAKAVFSLHCFSEDAWTSLGAEEMLRQIDALT